MDGIRAMPQSVEAERALLACCMRRPSVIDDAGDLGLRRDDFYRTDHQNLWQLLWLMRDEGVPIDMVSVPERVGKSEDEERYGGVAYVVELPDFAPSTANWEHYLHIVRDAAYRRRLIITSQQAIQVAHSEQSPQKVAERLVEQVDQVTRISAPGGGWYSMSELVHERLDSIEVEQQNPDARVVGVDMSLRDLNMKVKFAPTDLALLAARPSMGKTALALNIIRAQAKKCAPGEAVAMFSLEMARDQLTNRMLSDWCQIEATHLRDSEKIDIGDRLNLDKSAPGLGALPVLVDDTPMMTVGEIGARCRAMSRRHRLTLVVIDYLQLLQASAGITGGRNYEIAEISRRLKVLAKDLRVPVLALSQLSRGVEARRDKRPMMSDLRESGALEQDADLIMFLYRDEYYNEDSSNVGMAEIIVAKQRNGSTGTVDAKWVQRFQRFENCDLSSSAYAGRRATTPTK